MEVVENLDKFEKLSYTSVTIGTFDGVHLGHRAILRQLVTHSKQSGGKSVLITLWPHPQFILKKNAENLKLLTTFDEKTTLLEEQGVDFLIKIPFTPEFANLSATGFVEQILLGKIGTNKLLIGYDHHFGNNREGDINFLHKISQTYGFEVEEISRQNVDDIGISSTEIRNALLEAKVGLATSLLGRPYAISGTVIDGDKRGGQIGFPTANIHIAESYKLLPRDGSYAVYSEVAGKKYEGMLNIGFKPTVNGSQRTIEAHLFNFKEEIYNERITVRFIKSLREEMKFNSIRDLQNQLVLDKEKSLNILSCNH